MLTEQETLTVDGTRNAVLTEDHYGLRNARKLTHRKGAARSVIRESRSDVP